VRGLRRLAYRNVRTVGDGWVMIGDAAAFLDPIYSSGLFLALASAAMAADDAHDALVQGDVSAECLGRFVEPFSDGVAVVRRLIDAFYSSDFSFSDFARRFPQHRKALIDCLVGDVVGRDMSAFLGALDQMAPLEATAS
jgi:FADH2 O2-dependent halogenase